MCGHSTRSGSPGLHGRPTLRQDVWSRSSARPSPFAKVSGFGPRITDGFVGVAVLGHLRTVICVNTLTLALASRYAAEVPVRSRRADKTRKSQTLT